MEFRELSHAVQVKRYEAIPEVKACLSLPVEGLKGLPEGVEVGKSVGRARASVRVVRDTVFFYAHCDSLERLVEVYRGMVENRGAEVVVARERHHDWWVLVGVVVGFVFLAHRIHRMHRIF